MNSSNNQHLADSIMNWSMKISQNQYHMQAEYGSVNRRSNSRSPPEPQPHLPRSESSLSKLYDQPNSPGESASRLSPPRQFRNHKQRWVIEQLAIEN